MSACRRLATGAFLLAAAIAAAMPYVITGAEPAGRGADGFPGWPETLEGRPLSPLPLTRREELLARGLPGRLARFTDGRREIVLRWVVGATRQLHPVADCFRGIGWRVANAPMRLAGDGRPMSCIRVTGPDGQRLRVCERISAAGLGGSARTFSDVSSWYWHALWLGRREAWWAVVVAEPIGEPDAVATGDAAGGPHAAR